MALVESLARPPEDDYQGELLDRYRRPIPRLADGLDTQQIAGKLSYSERTVKNVLHGLMHRLQLRNRAHAVAFALREGYI